MSDDASDICEGGSSAASSSDCVRIKMGGDRFCCGGGDGGGEQSVASCLPATPSWARAGGDTCCSERLFVRRTGAQVAAAALLGVCCGVATGACRTKHTPSAATSGELPITHHCASVLVSGASVVGASIVSIPSCITSGSKLCGSAGEWYGLGTNLSAVRSSRLR